MTRQEKIALLKNLSRGKLSPCEAREQLIISSKLYYTLVGVDREEFEKGIFPPEDLIFVNGVAARIITEQERAEINNISGREETYV